MKINTFKRIYEYSIPLFVTAYIQFEFFDRFDLSYQFVIGALIFSVTRFLMKLSYLHFFESLNKYDQEKKVINLSKISFVRNLFFVTIIPLTLVLFFSPVFSNIRVMNNVLVSALIAGTLVFSLFSAYIFINVFAFRKLSS